MWGTNSTLIPIDPEVERTKCAICRAKQEVVQVIEEVKEEKVDMVVVVACPWYIQGEYPNMVVLFLVML